MSAEVIKLGGEIVASPRLNGLVQGISRLRHNGRRLVLVHGGGPQLTALSKRLSLPVWLNTPSKITPMPYSRAASHSRSKSEFSPKIGSICS